MGKRKFKSKASQSKKALIILSIVFIIAIVILSIMYINNNRMLKTEEIVAADTITIIEEDTVYKYGLPIESFNVTYNTIRQGQTLAEVFHSYGMSAQKVYNLTQCPDSVFDVRKVRAGHKGALLSDKDSTNTPHYFVYEESEKEYVVFNLITDCVSRGVLPSEWREQTVGGSVESSLWNAMADNSASPQLAVILSHIFGWTIDFFGVQKGDAFRLIYEQEYVEGEPLNNFRILAASFCASDSMYYAIPFVQEGEELYYNEKGNSLEGAFLKAPLDFYRISSRFTNSRYHPVLKRYRAHHGVDYAAPVGTPVYAIGSGKVIARGYQANGGGNYVKIRHNSTYTTTYMHLSRFAKGLKVGDIVAQKEVIGYVGSTGLSTGPHLDFRVYENGKPINPLTIKSQPKKPISEENKEAFRTVCDSLVLRLKSIDGEKQIQQ